MADSVSDHDAPISTSQVWFIRHENRGFLDGGGTVIVTPEQGLIGMGVLLPGLLLSAWVFILIVRLIIGYARHDPDLLLDAVMWLAVGALAGGWLWWEVRRGYTVYRRNRALVTRGKIVTGEVLTCFVWRGLVPSGTIDVWLRYRFVSPGSGRPIARWRYWKDIDLLLIPKQRFVVPVRGQTVAILYVDDRLYQVL